MPNIRIPFTGPAYESKSDDNNSQKLINWYTVSDRQGKSSPVLYPTPGAVAWITPNSSAGATGRGILSLNNLMYVVIGDKFYDVTPSGVATERGTLNTTFGKVQLATVGSYIMMIDGTNGYTWDGTTFAVITDIDFNDAATSLTSMDGYAIISQPDTDVFFISDLNDPTSWEGLDFATAEGYEDNLVAVQALNRQLWLIGEDTTEIWFNSGDIFPFTRIDGVFLEFGCVDRKTVATGTGAIYWVAKNRVGALSVIQTSGTELQIISNDAINTKLERVTDVEGAEGFCYTQDGHEFYVVTFPKDNLTLVYDAVENAWHERTSIDPNTNAEGHYRFRAMGYISGNHYVMDHFSGTIFELSPTTYAEDGNAIIRRRRTAPISVDNVYATMNSLTVEIDNSKGLATGQGSDPMISLRVSKDGGHIFSEWMDRSASKLGGYRQRAVWHRLGTGRDFVFELRASDPIEWVISGATAAAQVPEQTIG